MKRPGAIDLVYNPRSLIIPSCERETRRVRPGDEPASAEASYMRALDRVDLLWPQPPYCDMRHSLYRFSSLIRMHL